ncbi:type II secretion system secretin GspD [Thiomonas sp.]|jgi:general secretion pathway protein D|uniref:type II secretion system secretin GspD n=1 Tax=Thiomonas sp. TaxID=2047785 RepID=UPI00258E2764|nr:type II secretion system secretin GspD [Thiomonas sp.]
MHPDLNPNSHARSGISRRIGRAVALLLVPLLMLQPVMAQAPSGMAGKTDQAKRSANGDLTINLVNADIASAVQAVAAATGRNFIVDPRVKGQVTIQFEKPVPPQKVFQALLTQLRLAGFAVVEHDGVFQVVPEADAKLQSGPVGVGLAPSRIPGRGDQVVTQIFQLRNASASSLLPVLRPLISPNNTINVSPSGNALVVTDYADNLKRIARIIAALDVPTGTEVTVVPLTYAVASDLAPTLQKLIDMQTVTSSGPGTPGVQAAVAGSGAMRAVILPESASNSLIVRATNGAQLAEIEQMIRRLDRPQNDQDNIHVVYLRNANAADLARTLRGVLAAQGTGSAAGGQSQTRPQGGSQSMSGGSNNSNSSSYGSSGATSPGLGQAPEFAATSNDSTVTLPQGGTVYADNSLNALIINAPQPVYMQLRRVIERLDVRRAQVYVEALIAEVDANKAAQLGIQWQAIAGSAGNQNAIIGGSNYGTGGSNIINLQAAISGGGSSAATALASGSLAIPNGLNIGILHNVAGMATLGLLANFLQTQDGANILSAPNLMTLDNEEAKIVVGQNVPFVTGQYAQTGSSATVTPFQTIERKDVGLTLKVRPQITAGGAIKMDVYQEVSSISSTTNAAGIITNKRSIQTAVLVNDGQTIVLGGLMQDNVSQNNSKIPGLGDIPGLGALFRSNSRTAQKTDLMVFLRPIVVRTEDQGNALSQQRYDAMRGLQDRAQLPAQFGMPEMPGPVLPSLQGDTGAAPTPPMSLGAASSAAAASSTSTSPTSLAMPPAAPGAANALQSLQARSQADATVVELGFSQPLAAPPTAFTMSDPIRLVLDFQGAHSQLSSKSQSFDLGPLQSASVVDDQGKTRVIFNLTQTTRYLTEVQGKQLRVILTPQH